MNEGTDVDAKMTSQTTGLYSHCNELPITNGASKLETLWRLEDLHKSVSLRPGIFKCQSADPAVSSDNIYHFSVSNVDGQYETEKTSLKLTAAAGLATQGDATGSNVDVSDVCLPQKLAFPTANLATETSVDGGTDSLVVKNSVDPNSDSPIGSAVDMFNGKHTVNDPVPLYLFPVDSSVDYGNEHEGLNNMSTVQCSHLGVRVMDGSVDRNTRLPRGEVTEFSNDRHNTQSDNGHETYVGESTTGEHSKIHIAQNKGDSRRNQPIKDIEGDNTETRQKESSKNLTCDVVQKVKVIENGDWKIIDSVQEHLTEKLTTEVKQMLDQKECVQGFEGKSQCESKLKRLGKVTPKESLLGQIEKHLALKVNETPCLDLKCGTCQWVDQCTMDNGPMRDLGLLIEERNMMVKSGLITDQSEWSHIIADCCKALICGYEESKEDKYWPEETRQPDKIQHSPEKYIDQQSPHNLHDQMTGNNPDKREACPEIEESKNSEDTSKLSNHQDEIPEKGTQPASVSSENPVKPILPNVPSIPNDGKHPKRPDYLPLVYVFRPSASTDGEVDSAELKTHQTARQRDNKRHAVLMSLKEQNLPLQACLLATLKDSRTNETHRPVAREGRFDDDPDETGEVTSCLCCALLVALRNLLSCLIPRERKDRRMAFETIESLENLQSGSGSGQQDVTNGQLEAVLRRVSVDSLITMLLLSRDSVCTRTASVLLLWAVSARVRVRMTEPWLGVQELLGLLCVAMNDSHHDVMSTKFIRERVAIALDTVLASPVHFGVAGVVSGLEKTQTMARLWLTLMDLCPVCDLPTWTALCRVIYTMGKNNLDQFPGLGDHKELAVQWTLYHCCWGSCFDRKLHYVARLFSLITKKDDLLDILIEKQAVTLHVLTQLLIAQNLSPTQVNHDPTRTWSDHSNEARRWNPQNPQNPQGHGFSNPDSPGSYHGSSRDMHLTQGNPGEMLNKSVSSSSFSGSPSSNISSISNIRSPSGAPNYTRSFDDLQNQRDLKDKMTSPRKKSAREDRSKSRDNLYKSGCDHKSSRGDKKNPGERQTQSSDHQQSPGSEQGSLRSNQTHSKDQNQYRDPYQNTGCDQASSKSNQTISGEDEALPRGERHPNPGCDQASPRHSQTHSRHQNPGFDQASPRSSQTLSGKDRALSRDRHLNPGFDQASPRSSQTLSGKDGAQSRDHHQNPGSALADNESTPSEGNLSGSLRNDGASKVEEQARLVAVRALAALCQKDDDYIANHINAGRRLLPLCGGLVGLTMRKYFRSRDKMDAAFVLKHFLRHQEGKRVIHQSYWLLENAIIHNCHEKIAGTLLSLLLDVMEYMTAVELSGAKKLACRIVRYKNNQSTALTLLANLMLSGHLRVHEKKLWRVVETMWSCLMRGDPRQTQHLPEVRAALRLLSALLTAHATQGTTDYDGYYESHLRLRDHHNFERLVNLARSLSDLPELYYKTGIAVYWIVKGHRISKWWEEKGVDLVVPLVVQFLKAVDQDVCLVGLALLYLLLVAYRSEKVEQTLVAADVVANVRALKGQHTDPLRCTLVSTILTLFQALPVSSVSFKQDHSLMLQYEERFYEMPLNLQLQRTSLTTSGLSDVSVTFDDVVAREVVARHELINLIRALHVNNNLQDVIRSTRLRRTQVEMDLGNIVLSLQSRLRERHSYLDFGFKVICKCCVTKEACDKAEPYWQGTVSLQYFMRSTLTSFKWPYLWGNYRDTFVLLCEHVKDHLQDARDAQVEGGVPGENFRDDDDGDDGDDGRQTGLPSGDTVPKVLDESSTDTSLSSGALAREKAGHQTDICDSEHSHTQQNSGEDGDQHVENKDRYETQMSDIGNQHDNITIKAQSAVPDQAAPQTIQDDQVKIQMKNVDHDNEDDTFEESRKQPKRDFDNLMEKESKQQLEGYSSASHYGTGEGSDKENIPPGIPPNLSSAHSTYTQDLSRLPEPALQEINIPSPHTSDTEEPNTRSGTRETRLLAASLLSKLEQLSKSSPQPINDGDKASTAIVAETDRSLDNSSSRLLNKLSDSCNSSGGPAQDSSKHDQAELGDDHLASDSNDTSIETDEEFFNNNVQEDQESKTQLTERGTDQDVRETRICKTHSLLHESLVAHTGSSSSSDTDASRDRSLESAETQSEESPMDISSHSSDDDVFMNCDIQTCPVTNMPSRYKPFDGTSHQGRSCRINTEPSGSTRCVWECSNYRNLFSEPSPSFDTRNKAQHSQEYFVCFQSPSHTGKQNNGEQYSSNAKSLPFLQDVLSEMVHSIEKATLDERCEKTEDKNSLRTSENMHTDNVQLESKSGDTEETETTNGKEALSIHTLSSFDKHLKVRRQQKENTKPTKSVSDDVMMDHTPERLSHNKTDSRHSEYFQHVTSEQCRKRGNSVPMDKKRMINQIIQETVADFLQEPNERVTESQKVIEGKSPKSMSSPIFQTSSPSTLEFDSDEYTWNGTNIDNTETGLKQSEIMDVEECCVTTQSLPLQEAESKGMVNSTFCQDGEIRDNGNVEPTTAEKSEEKPLHEDPQLTLCEKDPEVKTGSTIQCLDIHHTHHATKDILICEDNHENIASDHDPEEFSKEEALALNLEMLSEHLLNGLLSPTQPPPIEPDNEPIGSKRERRGPVTVVFEIGDDTLEDIIQAFDVDDSIDDNKEVYLPSWETDEGFDHCLQSNSGQRDVLKNVTTNTSNNDITNQPKQPEKKPDHTDSQSECSACQQYKTCNTMSDTDRMAKRTESTKSSPSEGTDYCYLQLEDGNVHTQNTIRSTEKEQKTLGENKHVSDEHNPKEKLTSSLDSISKRPPSLGTSNTAQIPQTHVATVKVRTDKITPGLTPEKTSMNETHSETLPLAVQNITGSIKQLDTQLENSLISTSVKSEEKKIGSTGVPETQTSSFKYPGMVNIPKRRSKSVGSLERKRKSRQHRRTPSRLKRRTNGLSVKSLTDSSVSSELSSSQEISSGSDHNHEVFSTGKAAQRVCVAKRSEKISLRQTHHNGSSRLATIMARSMSECNRGDNLNDLQMSEKEISSQRVPVIKDEDTSHNAHACIEVEPNLHPMPLVPMTMSQSTETIPKQESLPQADDSVPNEHPLSLRKYLIEYDRNKDNHLSQANYPLWDQTDPPKRWYDFQQLYFPQRPVSRKYGRTRYSEELAKDIKPLNGPSAENKDGSKPHDGLHGTNGDGTPERELNGNESHNIDSKPQATNFPNESTDIPTQQPITPLFNSSLEGDMTHAIACQTSPFFQHDTGVASFQNNQIEIDSQTEPSGMERTLWMPRRLHARETGGPRTIRLSSREIRTTRDVMVKRKREASTETNSDCASSANLCSSDCLSNDELISLESADTSQRQGRKIVLSIQDEEEFECAPMTPKSIQSQIPNKTRRKRITVEKNFESGELIRYSLLKSKIPKKRTSFLFSRRNKTHRESSEDAGGTTSDASSITSTTGEESQAETRVKKLKTRSPLLTLRRAFRQESKKKAATSVQKCSPEKMTPRTAPSVAGKENARVDSEGVNNILHKPVTQTALKHEPKPDCSVGIWKQKLKECMRSEERKRSEQEMPFLVRPTETQPTKNERINEELCQKKEYHGQDTKTCTQNTSLGALSENNKADTREIKRNQNGLPMPPEKPPRLHVTLNAQKQATPAAKTANGLSKAVTKSTHSKITVPEKGLPTSNKQSSKAIPNTEFQKKALKDTLKTNTFESPKEKQKPQQRKPNLPSKLATSTMSSQASVDSTDASDVPTDKSDPKSQQSEDTCSTDPEKLSDDSKRPRDKTRGKVPLLGKLFHKTKHGKTKK